MIVTQIMRSTAFFSQHPRFQDSQFFSRSETLIKRQEVRRKKYWSESSCGQRIPHLSSKRERERGSIFRSNNWSEKVFRSWLVENQGYAMFVWRFPKIEANAHCGKPENLATIAWLAIQFNTNYTSFLLAVWRAFPSTHILSILNADILSISFFLLQMALFFLSRSTRFILAPLHVFHRYDATQQNSPARETVRQKARSHTTTHTGSDLACSTRTCQQA